MNGVDYVLWMNCLGLKVCFSTFLISILPQIYKNLFPVRYSSQMHPTEKEIYFAHMYGAEFLYLQILDKNLNLK